MINEKEFEALAGKIHDELYAKFTERINEYLDKRFFEALKETLKLDDKQTDNVINSLIPLFVMNMQYAEEYSSKIVREALSTQSTR